MNNFTYEEIWQCLFAFYKKNKESDYFIPLVKENALTISMDEEEAMKLFVYMAGIVHVHSDSVVFTILDKLGDTHKFKIETIRQRMRTKNES